VDDGSRSLIVVDDGSRSQEEAVERLDSSTKKILFENRRMAEELRLQVGETDELQKAKKSLEEDTKRLRREVALNEQSVKEYAKQGFRQSKEIKELSAKVKSLERSLSHSVASFEKEKDTLVREDQRRLAEVELDSQGLRQLVKLKSKELTHMKRLASIILQKRNEVETFLLDSIEFVKAEIARRRAEEERAMPRSRGRLPQLGSSRPSNLPASPEEHIDIRDLTWDDRERAPPRSPDRSGPDQTRPTCVPPGLASARPPDGARASRRALSSASQACCGCCLRRSTTRRPSPRCRRIRSTTTPRPWAARWTSTRTWAVSRWMAPPSLSRSPTRRDLRTAAARSRGATHVGTRNIVVR